MMFPIYDVQPKGDKWVLNEVHAYSTKEHSVHDIETEALAEKERIERELDEHMENARRTYEERNDGEEKESD